MVYKQDERYISWLNGLYPGRMVEAVHAGWMAFTAN